MADKKVIAASVQIDTEAATKNMLKLKGTVEDLRKELKKAEAGSDEQVAAFKKLQAGEKELAEAQEVLSKSNEKSAGAFSKIKGSLNEIPGAAGQASKGVSGLSATFKALLANPIVLVITAIVGALTLLYKAFASTEDGADKLEQVMKGVGAVIDVVFDRILKAGSAIVKFFTGDWSGALDDAKAAVTGFADEAVSEFNRAAAAAKRLQDLDDVVRDLSVSRAKLNKDLAATREILSDENATLAEKKKAIADIREAEEKQTVAEVAAAKERLAIAEEELRVKIAQGKATDEIRDNAANAQKELFAIEQEQAANTRKFNNQQRSLEREEEAKRKEERQKATEEEKARLQNLFEFERNITKLRQENYLATLKDGYIKEAQLLRFRIADEKKANEQAYKERKISLEQLNQLNEELEVQKKNALDALRKKDQEERKAKEKQFEKELAAITNQTRLSQIKDTRAVELEQLKIGYEEKLQLAKDRYKDDAEKLAAYTAAIDEQYRVERAAKEAKYKEEDDKKKLEEKIAAQEQIFTDQQSTLEAQKAALEAEGAILAEAFNNKVITEEEYGNKTEELSKKRMQIADIETEHRVKTFNIISAALNAFSDLVGKNTVVGKLAAIAATTINTYEAAWSIFKNASKNPASIPFPAYPYIQAGLAIAAGLKTVNDIVKVKTPGSGGGGTAPTASAIQAPAAPIAPTQTSTSLDQNTINNIGNAAAGGVNSVRAYVVEQDNAAAANRAARLAGTAVLGG